VVRAVAATTRPTKATQSLEVSAVPNSRILNLTYSTTAGPVTARAGVNAAATAALAARGKDLETRQSAVLRALQLRADALSQAVSGIDRFRAEQRDKATRDRPFRESEALGETRYRLLAEAGRVGSQISRATSLPLEIGHTLGPPVVTETHDDWLVAIASGLMLGLTGGLLLALGREALSARLSHPRARRELASPVVIRASSTPAETAARLRPYGAGSVMSADLAPEALRLADALDRNLRARRREPDGDRSRPTDDRRVLIVASARTRSRELRSLRDTLQDSGADIVGIVLARR
jgi:hypothetical protein